MSVLRSRAPRTAALFLGLALAATSLTSTLVADAAPVHAQRADAPVTVVSRLSLSAGLLEGGNTILVQGSKLATAAPAADDDGGDAGDGDDSGDPEAADATGWVAKTVTFGVLKKGEFVDGSVEVPAEDVTALSENALEVVVPEGSYDLPVVSVYVGDAVKGPKYSYSPWAQLISTNALDLFMWSPSAETGLSGASVKIEGEDLDPKAVVVIGGKKVKTTINADRDELSFAFPAGLVGPQDVVVTSRWHSTYVGYVTYTAIQPELDEELDDVEYAVTEAPTTMTVTGTHLDQLSSGTYTYDGQAKPEKVTVKPVKGDATQALVTVPKGAAADGTVTLSTKFGKTVTFDVERKASPVPTITGVVYPADVAKGGAATLSGTNLLGLKTLVLTKDAKDIKGSVTTVVDSTEAQLKLPKLADGSYTLKASTWSTTSATCTFTVASGDVTTDGCATADPGGDDSGDDGEVYVPVISSVVSEDGLHVGVIGQHLTPITSVAFHDSETDELLFTVSADALVESDDAESLTMVLPNEERLDPNAMVYVDVTNSSGTARSLLVVAPYF